MGFLFCNTKISAIYKTSHRACIISFCVDLKSTHNLANPPVAHPAPIPNKNTSFIQWPLRLRLTPMWAVQAKYLMGLEPTTSCSYDHRSNH